MLTSNWVEDEDIFRMDKGQECKSTYFPRKEGTDIYCTRSK